MLLETTEKCMWAGLSAARAGNHLGDIGHAVQSIAEAQGYGVVRDYVGHGIGRHMHEDPNVPNYGRPHSGIELEVGMVLAIEPMINMGTRKTRVGRDGWLVTTRDHKPSAHFEKTVAITEVWPAGSHDRARIYATRFKNLLKARSVNRFTRDKARRHCDAAGLLSVITLCNLRLGLLNAPRIEHASIERGVFFEAVVSLPLFPYADPMAQPVKCYEHLTGLSIRGVRWR